MYNQNRIKINEGLKIKMNGCIKISEMWKNKVSENERRLKQNGLSQAR